MFQSWLSDFEWLPCSYAEHVQLKLDARYTVERRGERQTSDGRVWLNSNMHSAWLCGEPTESEAGEPLYVVTSQHRTAELTYCKGSRPISVAEFRTLCTSTRVSE